MLNISIIVPWMFINNFPVLNDVRILLRQAVYYLWKSNNVVFNYSLRYTWLRVSIINRTRLVKLMYIYTVKPHICYIVQNLLYVQLPAAVFLAKVYHCYIVQKCIESIKRSVRHSREVQWNVSRDKFFFIKSYIRRAHVLRRNFEKPRANETFWFEI